MAAEPLSEYAEPTPRLRTLNCAPVLLVIDMARDGAADSESVGEWMGEFGDPLEPEAVLVLKLDRAGGSGGGLEVTGDGDADLDELDVEPDPRIVIDVHSFCERRSLRSVRNSEDGKVIGKAVR